MILIEGRNNHLCTTRRNAAHMGNLSCRAQAVRSSLRCYLFVVGRVSAFVSTKADGRMPGREAMDIAVCRDANADARADRWGTDSATPISHEKAQHRAPTKVPQWHNTLSDAIKDRLSVFCMDTTIGRRAHVAPSEWPGQASAEDTRGHQC